MRPSIDKCTSPTFNHLERDPMLTEQTMEKLYAMKLNGLAQA